MNDLILTKLVDKSFLYQGFTIPNDVVDSMRPWFGDLEKGGFRQISIEFDGVDYDLKVNSVNFDEKKYPDHSPVWQVRYTEGSPFLQRMRVVFSESFEYIKRAIEEDGDLKIPDSQVETIEFRRTDNPQLWKAIAKARRNVMDNVDKAQRQQDFKRWLTAQDGGGLSETTANSYIGSVAAISMPGPRQSTTGAWRGIYEYLIGEPPKKQIFEVADLSEFDVVYGKLTPYFASDKKEYGEFDQKRYDECFAFTHVSGAGDHQRMKNAYRAYVKFLQNMKKTTAAIIEYDGRNDDFLAAIRTKPFVLLAGISGTGKSRLVRQLAMGCCPADSALAWDDDAKTKPAKRPGNYELIPVRPNWHDSTELMGYVTRLTGDNKPKYVIKPFVKFLVKAWLHKEIPFFLCLDEMNLAPVEQYFAEYLSVIETRKLDKDGISTDVLVEFQDDVIDGVLSELSREIPSLAISMQPDEEAKSQWKKRDKDALYKLWDEFLAEWPISRLREIKLEEYTKAGSSDTFTYAIEAKLSNLGSIWGGSAFKFGIYSRDPNGKLTKYNSDSGLIGTDEYAWYSKYGATKEAAWSVVKERIVAIAEAAASGDFATVDKIDLPHVVKWKIAFLYQDRTNVQIVDIFKREWIVLLTGDMPQKSSFADRYLRLNEGRGGRDVFEWDDEVLSKRLAETLSSDGDFDDEEEDEPVDGCNVELSPVLEMIKRDKGIRIPPNLIVMGTVNMDETTCSFSRKVLDRAMTFELNEVDMDKGLGEDDSISYGSIPPAEALATSVEGHDFYTANKEVCDKIKTYLLSLNEVLDDTPFKFAYRSRNEIMLYCIERMKSGVVTLPQALDEATSMKILSRIEGDEQKLIYAGEKAEHNEKNILEVLQEVIKNALEAANGNTATKGCDRCVKKLKFMKRRLTGGFTNFFV